MRNPNFVYAKTGADQLHGNHAVDSAFFATSYNPSTSQIQHFKPLAIFYGGTARVVSDLVGAPKDCFLLTRLIFGF